jgi:class 3 adenylate cyclase
VSRLPTGTLTLLFTDIEGSTRLLDELGERYSDVLGAHNRTLRDAFERHCGVEVTTQGDSFFVVFSSATRERVGLPQCPMMWRTFSEDQVSGV